MLFDDGSMPRARPAVDGGGLARLIEKLAAGGMTMVLVTHEMAFAMKVAHRVIFMHQGKIHEQGGADILRHPQTPELRDFISNGL